MASGTVPRAPAPITTPISDTDIRGRLTGYVPTPWSDYFVGLDSQLASSFAVLASQQVPSASAAIGVTPITGQALAAGLYRVSYYLAILQADNVASVVAVAFGWTDRGVTRAIQVQPNLTTNATTGSQTGTLIVRTDRATPITYNTGYSSTGGAPKMIYGLDLLLEQIVVLP
ncbi:MAG TPA: hypothetical protein VGF35_06245 [Steroidobacteraceae bacterium]